MTSPLLLAPPGRQLLVSTLPEPANAWRPATRTRSGENEAFVFAASTTTGWQNGLIRTPADSPSNGVSGKGTIASGVSA